ncbi:MAG TPA: ATP synthase F1 subunit delta [Pyrinomonadaceae bacterium]|nr:ATP synthase F1 subunit delta [Pyrinomonadaceae bacterium]
MSSQTVARRYATALADVVIERGEAAPVQEELAAWGEMFSANSALFEAFSNPTVPYEQKGRVLSELITRTKVRPTTANFLRTLLKNQRLAELAQVNAKLAQVLDERAGVVSAEIKSARPISDGTKALLEQKLGEITGKKAKLTFATDESLLGGLVTRIGSTIYDGSVSNQLRRLREDLAG